MNELVQLNVIVIVTYSTFAARTAGRVTSTVPIVCAICADLVGAGVVRSLARPGGNVSGFTVIGPDLAAKRLELLKEISAVSRVLALHASASDFPVAVRWRMENERAARVLGLRIDTMRANTIAALEAGFVLAAREPGVGLTFMEEPLYFVHRRAIGEMVARHRVAAVFPFREHVEAGGLLSYGVDISELFSRAAGYVDKILKGAKPGDLPVEQPTKFDLVINMRAAKALGLAIPPGVLLRADHVIE